MPNALTRVFSSHTEAMVRAADAARATRRSMRPGIRRVRASPAHAGRNRKFQYCTIGAAFILMVILSFLSYRLYVDTKAEAEERSNRRQLLLVEQAGDRIASFLEALTASLRYSAGFLRTIEPDHHRTNGGDDGAL